MALFEYTAKVQGGRSETGRLAAEDLASASSKLSQMGIQVVSISEIELQKPVQLQKPEGARLYAAAVVSIVGPSDLMFFFRQLATMQKAGMGVSESLASYAQASRNPQMKVMGQKLSQSTSQGNSLSEGMRAFPTVFTPMCIAMVQAGESGGFLEDVFRQLDQFYSHEVEIKNMLRRATAYPKFLIVAGIGICLGANAIAISLGGGNVFQSWLLNPISWLLFAIAVFGLVIFFRAGKQNPGMKMSFDLLLVTVPGFSGVYRKFAMARFGRSLGALYRAGVAPSSAVQLAAQASGNSYLESKLIKAVPAIERGESITTSLKRTGEMPPIVEQMLSTGERTGDIDFMMEKMAEYFEDDAKTRANQLTILVGMIVLLAVIVMLVTLILSGFQRVSGGYQEIIESTTGSGGFSP